jgi:hypothetical protein
VAYGLGTFSLLAVDAMQSGNADVGEAAAWALLRSLIFIVGPLSVLGLDQALIRRRLDTRVVFGWPLLHIAGISLLAWPISVRSGTALAGWIPVLGAGLYGVQLLAAGVLRSRFQVARSVMSVHLWKFFLFSIIAGGLALDQAFSPLVVTVACLMSGAVVVPLYFTGRQAAKARKAFAPESSDLGGQYRVAVRFTLTSVLASGSVFLDQVILNMAGELQASQVWLRHVTFFTAPLVFSAGYLANVLAPMARANAVALQSRWKIVTTAFFALGVALALLSLPVGLLAASVMIPNADLDARLIAATLFLGLVRFIQLLPSVVVGMFSSTRQLDSLTRWGVIGLVLMVPVYLGSSRLGISPEISIFLSALIGLGARVAAGLIWTFRLLRSTEPLNPAAAFGPAPDDRRPNAGS